MAKIKDINILGHTYERNQNKSVRKSIGQYYTPNYIIKYILEKTVSKVDIVENPYIKIIDPSCGAGYFLLEVYDILKKKFVENIEKLNIKYNDEIYILKEDENKKKVLGKDYWKEENIHYHLLKNCIYGADKDEFAVKLTIEGLIKKEENSTIKDLNILKCDSLVKWETNYNWESLREELKNLDRDLSKKEFNLIYRDKDSKRKEEKIGEKKARQIVTLGQFWSNKFHLCVGNPPYIGHKQMEKSYKRWVLEEYGEVFKDKSDISFCFFSRILDILHPKGLCGIITSRYFMESPTGEKLRVFLKENTTMIEILDFYGANIFKDVGVATAIYFFERTKNIDDEIKVTKLVEDSYKFDDSIDLKKLTKSKVFDNFHIKQNKLENNRWILISDEVYSIYKKIEARGKLKLKDIVNSFQGIITGCDKAFVLEDKEANKLEIEEELLKKWLKNKNIKKYKILGSDLSLIYSNLIFDSKDYPNAIDFISHYSHRLENRRECRSGTRKWYELQWGRDIDLFQQPKIIFPYKSKTNRFAIDYDNLYFSADVYGLILKDQYKDSIPLEFLVGLLNSRVYEFYFKLFAKKMGKGIYDYYPNSLLDLNIISDTIIFDVKDKVMEIMENKKESSIIEEDINNIIMDYFSFTEKERKIINNKIL